MDPQERLDDDEVGTDRPARPPRWLAVLAALVLVVGLTVLAVGGVRYAQARDRAQAAEEIAAERETVSEVAAQVVINAFSFDHREIDASMQRLEEVSTGAFLDEQKQWSADVRERVVEQKAVTTASVSHSAVEELDREAGTAAAIVVFTVNSEREGQEDITARQAMRVDLLREEGGWKGSGVNQVGVTVPVGESSRSVQELEGEGGAGSRERGGSGPADDAEPTDGAAPTDDDTTTAPAPRGGR